MASNYFAKGLKQSALTVALGLCFVGGVQAQTNTAGAVSGSAASGDTITITAARALAKGLGLPYETTRRYVAKLLDEGLCVKSDKGGIIVPGSVLASPRMTSLATRHYAQILKFVGMVNDFSARAD